MADPISRMASLGLLSPTDRRDAAINGLLVLGAQLANRGAPRLSPTPPPIDLAGAMNVYNQGLETALKRNVFARDFERQQKIRDVYANPQTYAGLPNNIRTLAQSFGAAGDTKGAGSLIASALGRTPKYKVVQTGPNQYGLLNESTGAIGSIPGSDQQSVQFGGTGMQAQSANFVMALQDKIANGTATPQEQMAYKIAYETLGKTTREQRIGPRGERMIVEVPGVDMSGFVTPTLSSSTPQPQAQLDPSPVPPKRPPGPKVVSQGPPPKPNQAEQGALTFYRVMEAADQTINEIEDAKGQDAFPTLSQVLAGETPLIGGFAQRKLMSPDQQRYQTAALDWMMSTLRDESGAAISKDEARKQYERYFPVPGDSADVVAQKREARRIRTEAMRDAATSAQAYIDSVRGTEKETPKPLTVDEIRKKFALPPRN